MNQVDGTLILLFLPLAIMLCGYWLAAQLPENSASERLALALLFGLGLLLAAVAAVNIFRPLSGLWAYACLLPALPSLRPRNLALLARDLRALRQAQLGQVALILATFLILLLWPVLRAPSSLFYDGTSNHDSFFWIAGAEHLKRHSYFEVPAPSPTQPLTSTAAAIVGWKPAWGRMGGEGLLALASSVIGVSPLKLYLYATASLYFVWLAGAWLALKTFVSDRPNRWAILSLVGLQPIFLFFYGNSNLVNLLGALCGAAFVIGFARALHAGATNPDRWHVTSYHILIGLSFHGLLCVYPEMVPFVLLPGGLLWLQHWIRAGFKAGCRPCVLTGSAVLLGLALNGATAIRAYHGFVASFSMARADENWANLFNPLVLAEYTPALATLSVPAARQLGPWFGWPLTALFIAVSALLWQRSRDRFGLIAIFSGSTLLFVYTIATGFAYGWQKTVQFSGVLFGMAIPAALVHALLVGWPQAGRWNRLLVGTALIALLSFMMFATGMHFRETYKWSERKVISADWFKLRDLSRSGLKDAPVLVEAASFPMAFFHGMWSTYFLTDSHVYFGIRGEESGGYLRGDVLNESNHPIPTPAAYLVGRRWAETFDAASPRLLTGREFVLLSRSHRIFALHGFFPLNGPPDLASSHLHLKIRPATAATLHLTLTPRLPTTHPPTVWSLQRRSEGNPDYSAQVSGPPPWQINLPLLPRETQSITIETPPLLRSAEPHPYSITQLQITPSPVPFSPTDGLIDFTQSQGWVDYDRGGIHQAGSAGALAGPQDATLQFAATPAQADVELELIASLPPGTKSDRPLATELWFNGTLLFTGFFNGPGVLRTRILHEQWNQKPVAELTLRFPATQDPGSGLLVKTLTTRSATTPRP